MSQKETYRRYDQSPKGRERAFRRRQSPKGREIKHRYENSPKGREATWRRNQRRTKEQAAKNQREWRARVGRDLVNFKQREYRHRKQQEK